MQLSELQAEVLGHGFDPVQFGLSRITGYLNDGYKMIIRHVEYYVDESSQSFNTTPGTSAVAFPANFGMIRSLIDTTNNRVLQQVPLDYLDNSPASSGLPYCYAQDASTLKLYPTPDAAYPTLLRFWVVPPDLVNATDVPTLPSDYHSLLWYWAVGECYASEDDSTTAQYWENKFEKGMSAFAAEQRNPTEFPTQVSDMWNPNPGVYSGSWRFASGY